MAKRIIECQVNDEYVLGSGVVVGAAGSHDDVVLRLTFGDMWIGLTKYATFRDSKGENPSTVPIEASMLVDGESMTYDVHIPEVAKRYEGKMMLTLSGYLASKEGDGDSARYIKDMTTNTTTAYFRVLPSDVALLDDGTVEGTLADWVTQQVERMSAKVEELDNATDGILEAEAQREENENDRQSAEATRISNEEARIEAENERDTFEAERQTAEQERQTAEESRGQQFGDVATAVNKLSEIQDALLSGNGTVEEIVPAAYPVGAIYMSFNITDPAAIFGGTWEKLEGKFLVGTGDGFAVGNTGGSSFVNLSEDNLPANAIVHYTTDGYAHTVIAVEGKTITTQDDIQSELYLPVTSRSLIDEDVYAQTPILTLPPYLAVHMWKRIA